MQQYMKNNGAFFNDQAGNVAPAFAHPLDRVSLIAELKAQKLNSMGIGLGLTY